MVDTTPTDYDQQLAQIERFHNADKLMQASRAIAALKAQLEAALSSTSTSGPTRHSAELASNRLSHPPFPRIISNCDELHTVREALRSTRDWVLSYDGAETKVWYRREPATSSHTIRIQGDIRAPLINVAALIYEADLYEKLFWYVTEANTLPSREGEDTGSPLRRAAHIQVYAPWPLYKRDAAVYGFAADGLDEDDCVVVVSRSIRDSDPVDAPPPPATSRVVRVDMHSSGFELTPAGPGITKATFLYNVDPHLSFVPMALINWAARTLCRWSLRVLESRARDLRKVSDLYITRLNSEPVYEHIRKRLAEYWAAKGHTEESVQAAENRRVSVASHRSDTFDADHIPDGPPPSLIRQLLRGQQREANQPVRRRTMSGLLFGR